jgi:ribosomal protein S18 acetylase RimI-like enzyme
MHFKFSDFDSKCLGRKIATAAVGLLDRTTAAELRKELGSLGCELGFLKTEVFPRALIAEGLAKEGLEIADVKLWFARSLKEGSLPNSRPLASDFEMGEHPDFLEDIRKPLYGIADRSRFGFYFGSEKARTLYDAWLENLRKNSANVRWSIVSHKPTRTCAGLLAARIVDRVSGTEAEWDLVGVSEEFQGMGVGKAMAVHSLRQLTDEGVTRLSVGTLIDNREAANFYQALGFRLEKTLYQFHLYRETE